MQPVPNFKTPSKSRSQTLPHKKYCLRHMDTGLIPITDTPAKLSEVLTQNGLIVDTNNITQISLQRDGETYTFSLDDLLASNGPEIYLQAQEHISTQVLPYK